MDSAIRPTKSNSHGLLGGSGSREEQAARLIPPNSPRSIIWRAACLLEKWLVFTAILTATSIPESSMRQSLTGNLLVASSLVTDPMYTGGVCLIVHEDESNVIGVMLNRPIRPNEEALRTVLEQSSDGTAKRAGNRLASGHKELDSEISDEEATENPEQPSGELPWRMLHFGGPLSGPVVAVHQMSQYAEAETGDGIYVAAQKHHLEDLFKRNSDNCRVIVGHLGWQPEQLAQEIDAGIWHIIPATVDDVFIPASDMWPQVIRRATSNSVARWIGIPDVIEAGELN